LLTVKQLIEKLESFEPDFRVIVRIKDGNDSWAWNLQDVKLGNADVYTNPNVIIETERDA